MFISPSGLLSLVETKLWRNPESLREVVGQILDYATLISSWSYSYLEERVRSAKSSPLKAGVSLYQHVSSFLPDLVPGESQFIDDVQRYLRTNRFLLLIVGDGIREGVERVVSRLHNYPQSLFTFGLVEVQIYENPDLFSGTILVPQIVAKTIEIERSVVRVQTTGEAQVTVAFEDNKSETIGSPRRKLSEEVFLDEMQNPADRDVCLRLLALADSIGADRDYGAGSVSVRLPDPGGSKQRFTLFLMTPNGEFHTGWLAEQLRQAGYPEEIASSQTKRLSEAIRIAPHETRMDSLSRRVQAKELAPVFEDVSEAIRSTVEEIRNQEGGSRSD